MCLYLYLFIFIKDGVNCVFAAVVRACTDGAANILHDCKAADMLPPTLISGDFDSLRSDVLSYYDNIVKVIWVKMFTLLYELCCT